MTRALATVREVTHKLPHTNADALILVMIDGWQVVSRTDSNLHLGQQVIYFEIDSALPLDDPRFAFLEPRGSKLIGDRSYHVLRTAKLRGELSQGLIIPVTEFPELGQVATGTDVTEALGVVKYEPPIPISLSGQMVGKFPHFGAVQPTDAERVQNLTREFADLRRNHVWTATEKIDGTSTTFIFGGDTPRVCSRNWELVWRDDLTAVQFARKSGLSDTLGTEPWTIQGELAGPGIQKNPLGLAAVEFFVFSVFFDGEVVPRSEWPQWCLDHAVGVYEGLTLPATVAETVAQAEGVHSLKAPERGAEGIVWSTTVPVVVLNGRTGFKAINNKYLLKHGS